MLVQIHLVVLQKRTKHSGLISYHLKPLHRAISVYSHFIANVKWNAHFLSIGRFFHVNNVKFSRKVTEKKYDNLYGCNWKKFPLKMGYNGHLSECIRWACLMSSKSKGILEKSKRILLRLTYKLLRQFFYAYIFFKNKHLKSNWTYKF